ncbi:hypothetical protein MOTHE_c05730 [Moorella thermoacetica]|uniref:Uncharacterized protein n=2 Tax=Neomoorella thermoacetica TaxID=1525 RepID=A0A1D7X8S3_NEOTH|nr:hypothetical protein MOTHE_c05730 [Moorella thermoacetica]GAF26355.1 hypothetical protein MTY_1694 [Moorella thermoacetica Y72]AKX96021.1 hypothetical protein MOTHA_c06620 [Moorella thermoacetica]AOQ23288.1 hypothetical protein Maut_00826 [Moorella thermoacetica]APC07744.1 hypothetical protein MTJW_05720 [Moorella thermoacetica]
MAKAVALILIALIGGSTLYAFYRGVILAIFQPYFKTRQ